MADGGEVNRYLLLVKGPWREWENIRGSDGEKEGRGQISEGRGRKGAYLMRSADFGMRNVERIGHSAKCRA